MPELPEITVLAQQMKDELPGKTIAEITILQPKVLNVPEEAFRAALIGAQIRDVTHRGKWIYVDTDRGWLLLSLGMGGEVLLTDRENIPEKHRVVLDFEDGTLLIVNFWWFGFCHYAADLADHKMTAKLGPNALDLSLDEFRTLLRGRRGGIKSFLMNQSRIAGIGNVYIQDPLFKAKVHPLRKINTLSDDEIKALWRAIRETLQESIDLGGSAWEMDLYGTKGRWDSSQFLVAYREGEPCPECGTTVEKIKTGSTSGFICPHCQPLPLV
jgi:formamidopyrimidine-DNA glycosylase